MRFTVMLCSVVVQESTAEPYGMTPSGLTVSQYKQKRHRAQRRREESGRLVRKVANVLNKLSDLLLTWRLASLVTLQSDRYDQSAVSSICSAHRSSVQQDSAFGDCQS